MKTVLLVLIFFGLCSKGLFAESANGKVLYVNLTDTVETLNISAVPYYSFGAEVIGEPKNRYLVTSPLSSNGLNKKCQELIQNFSVMKRNSADKYPFLMLIIKSGVYSGTSRIDSVIFDRCSLMLSEIKVE